MSTRTPGRNLAPRILALHNIYAHAVGNALRNQLIRMEPGSGHRNQARRFAIQAAGAARDLVNEEVGPTPHLAALAATIRTPGHERLALFPRERTLVNEYDHCIGGALARRLSRRRSHNNVARIEYARDAAGMARELVQCAHAQDQLLANS